MLPAATGTIEWRAGMDGIESWHARVTTNDGRPWIAMPGIAHGAKAAAAAQARVVSRRMRTTGAVPAHTGKTVSEYFDRWIHARERRGLRSARNDQGRFTKWIEPHIGTRPIAEVESAELKILVQKIDRTVATKQLSWKSAISVWGVVTKLFDDACRSKDLPLGLRAGARETGDEGCRVTGTGVLL
jgi:hypothetical protein